MSSAGPEGTNPTEPEGVSAVESLMIEALTESINLRRYLERVDPDTVVDDRLKDYRELLGKLAAADALEVIDELVSFASAVMEA